MIYTCEQSKADAEGLIQFCLSSDLIKGRLDVSVWLPESCYELSMVTLLHGVYGSHWCWSKLGEAHLTAARLVREKVISPILLVMPSDGLRGDGSGYLEGLDECLTFELPALLSRELGVVINHQFISGLSMGGWGAMRLGFKYPEVYSGISAHSAITHAQDFQKFIRQGFPFKLSKIVPLSEQVVETALRFDCGKNDLLIESNRALHQTLKIRGVDHIYEEFEGEHSWDYWKAHVEKSFLFFEQVQSGQVPAVLV